MAGSRSYYDILNVAPGAELVVIEAAYRALMKKYHPDQGTAEAGDASAAQINEAFALLRDPERRAEYDQREWARQQSVRLAAYPPMRPPPRRSAFGWGGWIVALVLGGVVALMASRADGVTAPVPEAETAQAGPDYRSQPSVPDLPSAVVARIRADALQAASFVAAEAELPVLEAAPAPRLARQRSASSPRRARPRPRARAKPPARPDKDFLEREGYIY
jgi:curved DNA-binding protein CbpA